MEQGLHLFMHHTITLPDIYDHSCSLSTSGMVVMTIRSVFKLTMGRDMTFMSVLLKNQEHNGRVCSQLAMVCLLTRPGEVCCGFLVCCSLLKQDP